MLSLAAVLLAAAATPAPAASPAGIIPLPLQPVVPASQRTCSAKTASGLGIQTLKPAEGPKAGATDFVLINYIGYLAATGAVFDQAMTTPMQVDAVIPGFSEGLKLIPRGAIWRLCIPAAQGYGAEGSGPIPANSDLVFQVELLDSRTQAEVAAMQAAAAAPAAAAPAAGK
jgi:FKBP-type peptidyl-prolyl cis-trans isomerase FkpA